MNPILHNWLRRTCRMPYQGETPVKTLTVQEYYQSDDWEYEEYDDRYVNQTHIENLYYQMERFAFDNDMNYILCDVKHLEKFYKEDGEDGEEVPLFSKNEFFDEFCKYCYLASRDKIVWMAPKFTLPLCQENSINPVEIEKKIMCNQYITFMDDVIRLWENIIVPYIEETEGMGVLGTLKAEHSHFFVNFFLKKNSTAKTIREVIKALNKM